MLIASVALAGPVDDALASAKDWRSSRIAGLIPPIPTSAYGEAAAGSIATGLAAVEGAPVKVGWGVGIVDVAIDRYWAAVNDDRSKAAYTDLDDVVLLEGEYCTARKVVLQYLGVSLLADRWWVVEQRTNAALATASGGAMREMTWRSTDHELPAEVAAKTEGAVQVPFTEGAWLLLRLDDGRTLVEYHAASDPGGSVPAGLAASFAASGIKGTIQAMAKLAVEGPTCANGP